MIKRIILVAHCNLWNIFFHYLLSSIFETHDGTLTGGKKKTVETTGTSGPLELSHMQVQYHSKFQKLCKK